MASISGSGGTTSFAYDADGKRTTQSGASVRGIAWTQLNMPALIAYGGETVSFQMVRKS